MQRNETTNLILNETRRRQINTANNDDARNVPQPQQHKTTTATKRRWQCSATYCSSNSSYDASKNDSDESTYRRWICTGSSAEWDYYRVVDLLMKQTTEGTPLLKEGENGNRSELRMSIRSRSSRQSAIGKVIK